MKTPKFPHRVLVFREERQNCLNTLPQNAILARYDGPRDAVIERQDNKRPIDRPRRHIRKGLRYRVRLGIVGGVGAGAG